MNFSNTAISVKNQEKRVTKAQSNKLTTKEIIDEPIANESFEDTIMDDSCMSLGVADYEEGPMAHEEVVNRNLDFTNNKVVLSQNLEEFMDRQLQLVAERLADKKSIQKYNMNLRLNMKNNMSDIQEMLDDSQNIQNRIK